jgi:hypothetical protein
MKDGKDRTGAAKPVFESSNEKVYCPRWHGRTEELIRDAVVRALSGYPVTFYCKDELTAQRVKDRVMEIGGTIVDLIGYEVTGKGGT